MDSPPLTQPTVAVPQAVLPPQRKSRVPFVITVAVVGLIFTAAAYKLFAASSLAITTDVEANIYLNDQFSSATREFMTQRSFGRQELTVCAEGYLCSQQRFWFLPYITKQVSISLRPVATLDIPAVVQAKRVGDVLTFVTSSNWHSYTVKNLEEAENLLTTVTTDEDVIRGAVDSQVVEDLGFFSDFAEDADPFNFQYNSNIITYQIDQAQTSLLGIYNRESQEITGTFLDVKLYVLGERTLHYVDRGNTVYQVNLATMEATKVGSWAKTIESILPYHDGFLLLTVDDTQLSKLYVTDGHLQNPKQLDEGTLLGLSSLRESPFQAYYHKLQPDTRFTTRVVGDALGLIDTKRYAQQLFAGRENGYFSVQLQRINTRTNQEVGTVISDGDIPLFMLEGEKLVNYLVDLNDAMYVFTQDQLIVVLHADY